MKSHDCREARRVSAWNGGLRTQSKVGNCLAGELPVRGGKGTVHPPGNPDYTSVEPDLYEWDFAGSSSLIRSRTASLSSNQRRFSPVVFAPPPGGASAWQ